MRHPFQCTAVISRPSQGFDILLAASGPKLLASDLSSGKLVAEWPYIFNSNDHTDGKDSEERPTKKQRTGDGPIANPAITLLKASPSGQHVVVVTDDKIVRVFHIHPDGALQELSQRCMPKRPCAIDILPNSSVILCGDKFGDVYALPLIPEDRTDGQRAVGGTEAPKPVETGFKPTASNLTVHTKRNLRALEAQMNQKSFTARKEPLAFEHQLLLGHVSMLTDMRYASCDVGTKRRGYIITTDRDEHIRVSRGPPQSYVIEGFCLAHEEFVSRICLIPDSGLLISGGGDDWLGVWSWAQYKLLGKISLRSLMERSGCANASELQIAVSGLWADHIPKQTMVVAIEKLPMLFIISLPTSYPDDDLNLDDRIRVSNIKLDGNPIDATWINDRLIVSQDIRDETQPRLLAYQFDPSTDANDAGNPPGPRRLDKVDDASKPLEILNKLATNTTVSAKVLDDLLYSVNSLRKRRDIDADIEDAEDAETPGE